MMNNNLGYQKEEKYNILQGEKMPILQSNVINGSGSESQLDSIHSQKNEITGSSKSSFNPIGLSNNSNENIIKDSDNNSNSFNNSNKIDNNQNMKDLPISKVSEIKKNEQSSFKTGISEIIKDMNSDVNKNESSSDIDMKSEDFGSTNSMDINDIEDGDCTIYLISKNFEKGDIGTKDNSNNESDEKIKEEFKELVKKKIKEGFIPFFIKAEGFEHRYYYAKRNMKVKLGIDYYFKKINAPKDKYLFYYNDKLIDIEKTFKDLKIKIFGKIFGKLK